MLARPSLRLFGLLTLLFLGSLAYSSHAHAQVVITNDEVNNQIPHRGSVNSNDFNCVAKGDPPKPIMSDLADQIGFQFGATGHCGNLVTPELLSISNKLNWFPSVTFQQGDIVQCNVDGTLTQDWLCVVTRPDKTFTAYAHVSGIDTPNVQAFNADGTPIGVTTQVSQEQYEADQRQAALDRGDNPDCSLNAPSTWGTCLMRSIAGVILTFCAFLLGLAGSLLNWVMVKAVFQFSLLIGNSPGLLVAWGILRDIGNMMLLFGFIFIGLATILNLHTYAAKKTLPRLIIFAVLMNFSLFAAEGVIDISNGITSAIYNQTDSSQCVSATGATDLKAGSTREACAVNNGIAGQIMQSTGIASIYNFSEVKEYAKIDTSVLLGLSVLALIAAMVLFAAAIMLLIRAVVLTFIMVFAPLGFAGMAIPPLKGMGEKWWNALIHQSFFAPILFLMIFVSLKITNGIAGDTNIAGGSLAKALTNQESGTMGVIMVFALVIGFLLASLVTAKKFGAAGANFAVKTAAGATIGTAAWAGRSSFGRMSSKASEGIRKTKFGRTQTGKLFAESFAKGGKASFDFRSTTGGALLGKQVGDLGKGQKGGFDAAVHDRQKSHEAYVKSLRQTDKEKEQEAELKNKKQMVQNSKEQEAEGWKEEKREREEAIQSKSESNTTSKKRREQEQAAQIQRLQAAQAALAATPQPAPGDIAGGARRRQAEEAERRENESLQTMLGEHAAEAEREKQDLQELRTQLTQRQKDHDENMKGFDKQMKDIDRSITGYIDNDGHIHKGVDAKAIKLDYAERIHRITPGGKIASAVWKPSSPRARHHTYEAIVRDFKKTPTERLFGELKESIDSIHGDTHDIADQAEHNQHAADTGTPNAEGRRAHADDHG